MEASAITTHQTSEVTNTTVDAATAELETNAETNTRNEDNQQSSDIISSVEEKVGRAIESELSNENESVPVVNIQDKELEQRVEKFMVNQVERGFVKWFNNKVGYGFITVRHVKEGFTYDIFVHHSAIQVKTEQYRYLVQGEYVQFKWSLTNNEQYKWHAISISGIDGGPLMCETRNELRAQEDKRTRRERGMGSESSHGRGSSYIVGATNNRFARKNTSSTSTSTTGRSSMRQNGGASAGPPPVDSDGFQLVERRH